MEITINGVRRRRWPEAKKLRTVEEPLYGGEDNSAVACRNGVAPDQLFRWRKTNVRRARIAVIGDDLTMATRKFRKW